MKTESQGFSDWVLFKCKNCNREVSYCTKYDKPPILENGNCNECGSKDWEVRDAKGKLVTRLIN